ncbi:MAG: class I SAM-dependent methyltransferase [Chloroflexota bacterium]
MDDLTDDQDAFGRLLDDYLHGGYGVELVEWDDGLLGMAGGPSQYFALYDAWPPHERAAMDWVRGRVLDIGCGAGRHALHLQEQGLDVLGIDVSPRALAVCRERGLREARVLDIARIDRDLGLWDTMLLLGANFGLMGSADGARALLARLADVGAVSTRIIAESRDPATASDPAQLAYQAANVRGGRLPGQLRLRIRYKRYATPWFEYLFVAKAELEQLLRGTEWRVTQYLDAEMAEGGYIALIEKIG